MLKKYLIITTATLFFAWLVMPHPAAALTLTPMSKEVSLTAGQKSLVTVELKNETQKDIQLTTEVVNFTAKDETGEPAFDFTAKPTDLAAWIEVDKGPLTIKAGAKKEVDVVFNTPADAKAGGYYAAVFFSEVTNAEKPSQVNIQSKLGTLFLATVKGEYVEKGSIVSFSTSDGKTSYATGPIGFSLRFLNSGAVHLQPSGTVVIKSMFGSTVKTIQVNKDAGAVLPQSTRAFVVDSWKDVGNAFGKYTATVTLSSGTVMVSQSVSFWIFSTLGIVITVAVVVILIILIVLLARKAGGKKTIANKEKE